MRSRVQDKIKAISLRMEGYSYKEIMSEVPVSKSTLSGWLRYIKLSVEQESRLFSKIATRSDMGRAKGAITNRRKRVEREQVSYKYAEEKFEVFKEDPFFWFGVALYWAEGAKKSSAFQFMNSDPKIIELMTIWIEKFLGLDRNTNIFYRLYIHHVYSHENCEDYWKKYLRIVQSQMKKTIFKPTNHLFKKNPEYKGCMRIEVSGIRYFQYIDSWQKMLANKVKMG